MADEKRNYFIKSNIKPNKEQLSESDIEALDEGIKEYGYLTFNEVLKKNHNEKCWQETELNNIIPFEKMIYDIETIGYLQKYSENRLMYNCIEIKKKNHTFLKNENII